MTAITQVFYYGDGSQVQFTFPFDYIDQSHIKVGILNDASGLYDEKAQGDVTYGWFLANASTVQFNTAPPAPTGTDPNIKIYRQTDSDAPYAVFTPGSPLKAVDLNDNFEQSIYVVQEATTSAGVAGEAAIIAVDAALAAEASAAQAQADATQAQADAATAVTTANGAKVDASNALIAASAAQAEATAASVAADAAMVAAQDAEAAAAAALVLVTDFVGSGEPYDNLYSGTAGAPGSKTIDLGDLTTIASCSNAYFPGEDVSSTVTYNMGLGCSSIDYGSLA